MPSMRPPACANARGPRAHHECVPARGGQLALLYAALYTIAAGAGGLKANVSGFGPDQFDARDPREERAMVKEEECAKPERSRSSASAMPWWRRSTRDARATRFPPGEAPALC